MRKDKKGIYVSEFKQDKFKGKFFLIYFRQQNIFYFEISAKFSVKYLKMFFAESLHIVIEYLLIEYKYIY